MIPKNANQINLTTTESPEIILNRKCLRGAATDGRVRSLDGEGTTVEPTSAIFPILRQTKEGYYYLVGTGFFITNNGIFVTAKHVLMDGFDANSKQTDNMMIVHFANGTYYKRQILRFTSHSVADICVGIVAPMAHTITGESLKNKMLSLVKNVPSAGTQLCTYAYPQTVIKHGVNQELHFYANYFEGIVQEHYPSGRDNVMLPGPCVQTSMYIHGGASGGPVFDCEGKVFAINSTGYEDDDLSFVTPIHTIVELHLKGVKINNNESNEFLSVNDLIKAGFIDYDTRLKDSYNQE